MKYMDYLQKYQDLGQRDWKDFKEILDEIDKVKLERVENPTLNAVVVLGYSGNGKTTAIKNFVLNHPEYKIISIDEICKSFINQNNKYPNIYELQSLFGKELEKSVINKENIILDPGIGFAKTYEENLMVMNNLKWIKDMGYPVLLATSRKSMIGIALDLPVDQRLEGTLATTVIGIMAGCEIIRVHDVLENKRVCMMTDTILRAK